MKKVIIGIAVFVFFFSSCEKQDLDAPGSIQGMGDDPRELQIEEPFVLPPGISLIGEITGLDDAGTKSGELIYNSEGKSVISFFGSGGKLVRLKLTLLNSTNFPRTIFFPKGLLWKCNIAGYQHAILLQTTWVSIGANSQRTIVMDLYCINYGLLSSDQQAVFQILGTTSSMIIKRLLDYVGWRIINYEMIFGSIRKSGDAKGPSYEEITDRLQTIIWNLTNHGIDISEDDKAFLESIPELDPSLRPELDENSQYPEYFEEFVVSGK